MISLVIPSIPSALCLFIPVIALSTSSSVNSDISSVSSLYSGVHRFCQDLVHFIYSWFFISQSVKPGSTSIFTSIMKGVADFLTLQGLLGVALFLEFLLSR